MVLLVVCRFPLHSPGEYLLAIDECILVAYVNDLPFCFDLGHHLLHLMSLLLVVLVLVLVVVWKQSNTVLFSRNKRCARLKGPSRLLKGPIMDTLAGGPNTVLFSRDKNAWTF